MHPKRHPIRMEYWVGCDADGRLTALRARMVGDSGPYASVGMKVLERAAGHAVRPVSPARHRRRGDRRADEQPGVRRFSWLRRQPGPVRHGRRHRSPGRAEVGISAWEMRFRNVGRPRAWSGDPDRSWTTDRWAPAPAWRPSGRPTRKPSLAGKAVGLGFGLKNSGLGNGLVEIVRAVVRFSEEGDVEVRHCWTEMGQGVHTVALQVAVEELGVDPRRVRVVVDTTRELGAGQTTGSRGTLMGAGAVADACRQALADGCRPGVDYEGEYRVDWTNSLKEGLENPVIHSAFCYAAQLVSSTGRPARSTGSLAVHDVGRAVNPTAVRGSDRGRRCTWGSATPSPRTSPPTKRGVPRT